MAIYWCRVMTVLPINNDDEIKAATLAVDWHVERFGGLTRTIFDPAVYVGHWKSKLEPVWYEDVSSIIFTDVPLTSPEVDAMVDLLKEEIGEIYDNNNSHQEEIYVVVRQLLKAPYEYAQDG